MRKDKVSFAQLEFEVRIGCQEGICKGTPPKRLGAELEATRFLRATRRERWPEGEFGLLEGSTPTPRNEPRRGWLQRLEVLPPVGPCRACPSQASRTPLPLPVAGSWRLGAAGRGGTGLSAAGAWRPEQLLRGRWAPASGRGGPRWADGRPGADAAVADLGARDGPRA